MADQSFRASGFLHPRLGTVVIMLNPNLPQNFDCRQVEKKASTSAPAQ
jgi:hypothetical protein